MILPMSRLERNVIEKVVLMVDVIAAAIAVTVAWVMSSTVPRVPS